MSPPSLAAALQAIESDEEREREAAIPHLIASGRPEALIALERASQHEDNLRIRFMAKEGSLKLRQVLGAARSAAETGGKVQALDLGRLESRLTDPDAQRRLRGVRSALAHRDARALPLLARALEKETDTGVVGELCVTLGVLGGKGHGGALLARLQDPSPEVRRAAIKGLGYLKDPSVYPTLVAMLQDRDKEVRAKAFESLVKLGKPRLQKLLERMIGSSRSWPRKAAVRACARISSPEFVKLLVQVRQGDKDERIRREAVKALVHLARKGNPTAAQVLAKEPARELDGPAPSTDGLVMEPADQGAGSTTGRDAEIEALRAQVLAAQQEAAAAQEKARQIAAQMQGKPSSPPSRPPPPAIVPPAAPGSGPNASSSASVSGTLPQPPVEFLDIEDSSTSDQDSLELSTAEVMVGGLHDPDPQVRMQNLAEILAQKDRSLSQQLAARLPLENDNKVLAKLLLAVGKLGRKKDARRVVKFLESKDARVRANAVEALAMLGDDSTLEAIVPLLDDEDNRTRANAVVALKDHPSVNVLDTLRGMAKSGDLQMRLSAVFAALEIGTTEVDPILHFLLKDKEQDVKEKALSALNLLEDQRIAPMNNPGVDLDSTQAHMAKLSAWRGDVHEADEEEEAEAIAKSVEEEAQALLGKLSGDAEAPASAQRSPSGSEAGKDKAGPAGWGRPPPKPSVAVSRDETPPAPDLASRWQGFMEYLQGTGESGGGGKAPAGAGADEDRRKLIGMVVIGMVLAVLAFVMLGGSEDDGYVDDTKDF